MIGRGAEHHMEVPATRRGFHDDEDILGRRPENVLAKRFYRIHVFTLCLVSLLIH